MSVVEVKTFFVRCEMQTRDESKAGTDDVWVRCPNQTGPHFAQYESEVPIPEGWGWRSGWAGSHYGYQTRSLFCPECIARHGIEVDG